MNLTTINKTKNDDEEINWTDSVDAFELFYGLQIPKNTVWVEAATRLTYNAFKVWLYCAAYPSDKELDEGITKWLFDMDREDFCAAINELSYSGYLRMDNSGFQFSRDGAWSLSGNSTTNS